MRRITTVLFLAVLPALVASRGVSAGYASTVAASAVAQRQVAGNRLSADNAVLLLLDHQTGLFLFKLVNDYKVNEFKNNVLALAATAKLYNVPMILSTSVPALSTTVGVMCGTTHMVVYESIVRGHDLESLKPPCALKNRRCNASRLR